jgi:hypothetical protein
MWDRLPRGLISHIKLCLRGVAFVFIFGIPAVTGPSGSDCWRLTAIIAIAVGTIYGLRFWMGRREVDGIRQSIREIAEHVSTLSEGALGDWEEKYDEALKKTAEVEAVSRS